MSPAEQGERAGRRDARLDAASITIWKVISGGRITETDAPQAVYDAIEQDLIQGMEAGTVSDDRGYAYEYEARGRAN